MNIKLKKNLLLLVFSTFLTSIFAKNCESLPDKDILSQAEVGCCYPSLLGRVPSSAYMQFMENVVFLEQICRNTCSAFSTYENIMVSQELTMKELGLAESYDINYKKAYDNALLATEKFSQVKNTHELEVECLRRLKECEEFCNKYSHYLYSIKELNEMGFELTKDTKQLCLKN